MQIHSPNTSTFQPSKALLCLLAATLFWFLNALNKTGYTLNVDYPIHFIYNEAQFTPTTPLPKTVRVNVSSDGWGLLRHTWLPFRVEPVNYVVRDPLHATSINTSSLTAQLAEHIKRLHVNYVVADRMDIHFDRRITKTILLKVDSVHVDLGNRFAITSVINVTPRTVEVTGPARLVQGLPDVLTLRVPRKNIVDLYDEELPLTQLRHPLLRPSTDRVAVSFEVGELLSPPSSGTNP